MTTTRPVSRRSLATVLTAAAAMALVAGAGVAPADAAPKKDRPLAAAMQPTVDAVHAAGAVGVVAAVEMPGASCVGAAGYRDLEKGLRAGPQDRARFSSVTKAMTATLAMQEIEAGHWTIDTTIDDILPGLYPGHGDVTVGQLLNHTSGMPDAIWALMEGRDFWDITPDLLRRVVGRTYTEREIVDVARTLDWLFAPGADMAYSNTGYVVLSLMLEKQTGQPIEKLMKQRIFTPAKMNQSWLGDSALTRGRTLVDYGRWDGAPVRITVDESIFSGAAAVYAQADDVTKFYDALLGGRLVGKKYVDLMSTPTGAAARYGYGYGLYTIPDPCPAADGSTARLVGHDGAGFGSQAVAFASPDGTRKVAMAWTGRSYRQDAPPLPIDDFIVTAFRTTCPTKPATSGGPGRSGDGTGSLRF
ncbi:serine hydrolase domain-containing protein [Mobilicoccus massiliensis]|uniref:serine hydrolase domain-containing protein n=1 Tax=Mobilicoccus massiliensis TaxID=1522310 RepID=UPI00058F28E4|nr:serine hydrolase domain-containing protein [Mobilicoccus massiliensis]